MLMFLGGAFIYGAGQACRQEGISTALTHQVTVWAIDYRMPPEHPFPAALDDAMAAYRALLVDHEADDIVISGGSAGANIALATVLRARDEGLPMPSGVIAQTPVTDIDCSGDTWAANDGLDGILVGDLKPPLQLYAGDHDVRDPYISPLWGDYSLGFPPTFLSTGTRDRLLSDTVRLHTAMRRARIPVELRVMRPEATVSSWERHRRTSNLWRTCRPSLITAGLAESEHPASSWLRGLPKYVTARCAKRWSHTRSGTDQGRRFRGVERAARAVALVGRLALNLPVLTSGQGGTLRGGSLATGCLRMFLVPHG